MKLFSLAGAIALGFSTSAAAQDAEFVKNWLKHPIGPYFKIGPAYYRVNGAAEVNGLGSYGRATGKGPFGILAPNGYKANGTLAGIEALKTQSFKSTAESITNAASRGNVNAKTPSGDAIIDGNGKLTTNQDASYTVFVVRPDDWKSMYSKLNDEYANGDAGQKSRFQDPVFRIVDGIVYATDLKIKRVISFSGQASGQGAAPTVVVEGELEGDGSKSTTFELSGEQVIAYSFRRLCWSDETIVEAREDNPGASDTNNCNSY